MGVIKKQSEQEQEFFGVIFSLPLAHYYMYTPREFFCAHHLCSQGLISKEHKSGQYHFSALYCDITLSRFRSILALCEIEHRLILNS